jgi:hypothetical protein
VSNDVEFYAEGLMAASVCAPRDMPRDEVVRLANLKYPAGTDLGWAISADATFRTGEPNPSPCDGNPETRLHYLLNC